MTLLGTGVTASVLRANNQGGRYGSQERDWGSIVSNESYDGCLFAPQTSVEDRDGRDAVVADATIYMPTGTDVTAHDRVQINGVTYDVDGQPSVWSDPFGGGLDGIEVRLKLVTG